VESVVPVSEEQRIIVCERLRILAIAAYIRGGIIAAFSSFFLLYVIFMIGVTLVPDSAWTNGPRSTPPPMPTWDHPSPLPTPVPIPANNAPPKILFRIMAAVFGGFVLAGWAIGGLTAYAGWCIQKRRRKVLIYTMSALNCAFLPYGTLFGVAAIIVLSSPAAKLEFASSPAAV
jgi:hypothetical protein